MSINISQYRTRDYSENVPWVMGERFPVVSFQCDQGGVYGFLLDRLSRAHYDAGTVRLWWNDDVIEIKGPKALVFFQEFTRGDATWLHSDGEQITSVQHRLAADTDAEAVG